MVLDNDGVISLFAGIVRQSYIDYTKGYKNRAKPDAAEFLRACGLLDENDVLDRRFVGKGRTARQSDPVKKRMIPKRKC
jgi:hypothetical protein